MSCCDCSWQLAHRDASLRRTDCVVAIGGIAAVITELSSCGMACSSSLAPLPASLAGGAGARPDHPITGLGRFCSARAWPTPSAILHARRLPSMQQVVQVPRRSGLGALDLLI